MRTLGEVSAATGFGVLEHLEAEAEVPVLAGLQAQGDLFIVPVQIGKVHIKVATEVPAEGVAVIEAVGGGHEHRLFAGEPGTAFFDPRGGEQAIGVLDCTAPAFMLHPEHGASGIAPGRYELRRQREEADAGQRLVAD